MKNIRLSFRDALRSFDRAIDYWSSPVLLCSDFRKKFYNINPLAGLVLITPGVNKRAKRDMLHRLFPEATLRVLPKDTRQEHIIQAIVDNKSKTPLEQIYISSHGRSMHLSPNSSSLVSDYLMPMDDLLSALNIAQHEHNRGTPFTKRIVFAGCNTFTNLSEAESLKFQRASIEMCMEIVGTTSYLKGTTARFIAFYPDGSIKRDTLDSRVSFKSFCSTLKSRYNGFTVDWLENLQRQSRGPFQFGPHP